MKIIEGTSENFEKEVLKSEKPVLVDFNADWCGPCQMMQLTLDKLAEECDDYKIVSVNIDSENALARRYEVSSIPCLVIFKNGEEFSRSVGVQSKRKLLKALEKAGAF